MARNETIAGRGVFDGLTDYLLFGGLACIAALVGGVWLTGQIAGLVFAFSWPDTSLGDCLSVLARLPHHLPDPKQAWPASARDSLPGWPGFLASALITLTGIVTGAVLGIRRIGSGRSRRGFASRSQLARSMSEKAVITRGPVVRPSVAGTDYTVDDVGVRIGRTASGGMPLALSSESSVLLMSAPRQGKTSMVIIPWLHRWPGPALVTSVRKDIVEATALLRAQGDRPVLVMAPTGMIHWPDLVRWSPSSGCENFDKARARADVMVTVGKTGINQDSGNAAYFGMTATNLLAGWLHAAALSGGSMDDVLRWALDERLDQPVKILRDHPGAAPGTAAMLDAAYRSPEGTRSNLWTTVQTAVAPLLAPTARATFTPAAGEGIDLEAFLKACGTIYLLVSEKQATDLAPLISAFVDELTETAKKLADASPGGRLDPPLGLICDEVANVVPLPHLPALMSYAGGSGMFIVAVLQNMAQAENRWGREGAAMLWGASTVKIALGGLSGDELRDLSALAGEYRELLTTHQRGSTGHTVQSTLHDRKTLAPEAIRTLSEERREALVIHATTPAVLVRMTRHYEGPDRDAYARSVAAATQMIAEPLPSITTPNSAVTGEHGADNDQGRNRR
ncbi:type IV secretory system conjugative DNA transfer family protein [Sphaerisporangium viridialbum]|uniref:type IV secretory system conjugative DNA transfer family protein n=1 Tax=Sphaerisporangium viridialbum TaxID=46189 RepID=UPI003C75E0FB